MYCAKYIDTHPVAQSKLRISSQIMAQLRHLHGGRRNTNAGKETEMGKKDRNDYIRIARELGYDNYVITRLLKAKDETEATNIMIDARRSKD